MNYSTQRIIRTKVKSRARQAVAGKVLAIASTFARLLTGAARRSVAAKIMQVRNRRHVIFKSLVLPMVTTFFVAVTGCGGGGSSSGGGGSGGGGTVYTGTATITLSAPGVASQTTTFPITITVSGGIVTVSDPEITGSAPISADGTNFTVRVNFVVAESGVSCNGTVIYTGTIAGANVSGPVSGSAPCSVSGTTITVTINGSFSANQSVSASALIGDSMSNRIKTFVKQLQ